MAGLIPAFRPIMGRYRETYVRKPQFAAESA